jgi:hypothetical protein
MFVAAAGAAPYTVAYTDGGTWQTLYAQGFSTSLGANPNPALANGTPVYLNQFQFFKSGTPDTAANIQLAIFNTMYPNLNGLTTQSSSFVGLSNNTVLSTAGINTGDPITFTFNSLPLVYSTASPQGDYSAVFVNVGVDVGSGAPLAPVRVSALAANYAETPPGSGSFHPVTNYGTESQFQYTTSNFINGSFFSAFSFAGDANFKATIDTVPEPCTMVLGLSGIGLLGLVYRRHKGIG